LEGVVRAANPAMVFDQEGCSLGHGLTRYSKTSEGSLVDIARSEAVEADLDRIIERRSSRELDPDEREELWKASVRAYTARRREELRAAWCEHHQGQAARLRTTLEALIARHEAEADRLAP
jgi:hypothetical protein